MTFGNSLICRFAPKCWQGVQGHRLFSSCPLTSGLALTSPSSDVNMFVESIEEGNGEVQLGRSRPKSIMKTSCFLPPPQVSPRRQGTAVSTAPRKGVTCFQPCQSPRDILHVKRMFPALMARDAIFSQTRMRARENFTYMFRHRGRYDRVGEKPTN